MKKMSPEGVIATNSIDYIDFVFSSLCEGKTIVNLRDENDERISRLKLNKIHAIGDKRGWYKGASYTPAYSEDIAQILFTSGTEGLPKAVFISQRALANTTERLVQIMQLDESIREYIGVPVHYSFGFGRARSVSAVGGAFFIPQDGFNPMEIAEMLHNGEINAVSAVPTLWRALLEVADLFTDCGANMRWIEIGSQYMSREEKESLKKLFPNAKIIQHYGLTEASRTTFLKIHEAEGELLESVGICIGGSEVAINDSGKIRIRGKHLASKILLGNDQFQEIGEDWLDTSDLGSIENGYLFYLGRSDDQINCGGIKISPDHVERKLSESLGVTEAVALVGVPDPIRGQKILCAILENDCSAARIKSELGKILNYLGLEGNGAFEFTTLKEFPRTPTGKLQRKKIAENYLLAKASDLNSSSVILDVNERDLDADSLRKSMKQIWEKALGATDIPTNVSFFDLGGDSLSCIKVAFGLEKLGLPRQVSKRIFQGATIDELASTSSKVTSKSNASAKLTFNLNLVRGFLVLLVVAAHWMPGVMERLPPIFSQLNKYLAPLYSAGTPGFAIIFGVGIGFFYLPRYKNSVRSLYGLVGRNIAIVGVGLIILALTRLLQNEMYSGISSPMTVVHSFYGVIYYYFFAIVSIPFWAFYLKTIKFSIYGTVLTGICLYCVHNLIEFQQIPPSNNAIIQAINLLLTAKYNYFEMSAWVFLGIAVGMNMKGTASLDNLLKGYFYVGACCILLSVIVSYEMSAMSYWITWPKPLFLWSWLFYFGCVLVMLSISNRIGGIDAYPRLLAGSVAAIGILAFPIFITHEMVIPIKDILKALGLKGALIISMVAFFSLVYFLIQKIYKTYYSVK